MSIFSFSSRCGWILISCFALMLGSNAFGQQTWFWQNPRPQGHDLIDVHMFDLNNMVAVGYAGTIIRTTNGGTTWTTKALVEGQFSYFVDVAFANQNVGFAVGFGGSIIRTTNGGVSWRSQTSATTQPLYGVYMFNADTAIAVGGNGSVLRTTNGGVSWTFQTSGVTQLLTHIVFMNSLVGTVVGFGGTILRTTDGGVTWTPQTSGTTQTLFGVDFTDVNNGTAVGASGTILRTTNGGTAWSPQASGATGNLWGVRFTGLNTACVTGQNGIILRTINAGGSWTQQALGGSSFTYGVHFSDLNNGVAVSANGGILKTSNGGINWTDISSGTRRNLRNVFFADGNNGIVVGEAGLILQTTNGGTAWVVRDSLTANALTGGDFCDLSTGIAVGWGGTILRTVNGGVQWSVQTSGTTLDLFAAAFATNTTGVVSGLTGTILQTSNQGVSWTPRASGTGNNLLSIVFLDQNTGVIVGSAGTILRTTNAGVAWTVIGSPTSQQLNGVAAVSASIVVAVGSSGTVLRSTNAGLNWTVITSGTTSELTAVSFQDANSGTVTTTSGTVLNTINGGLSWSVHPTATVFPFNGIVALPGRKRIAVGALGTILSTGVFPDSVAISSTVPFPPNPSASTDYRLFGLPGNATGTIAAGSILSGAPPVDWRLYRDNGTASDYLVELTATSVLTSGEGYWLLKRGSFGFNGTITLPPLNPNDTYSIPLHAGWNIIANPFDKPVQWADIGAVNNRLDTVIAAVIRGYAGSYITSTVLDPFSGYYFFNDPTYALSSLRIPYPFIPSSNLRPESMPHQWQLQLVYGSDINRDPENFVGIDSKAKEGLDMMDMRKPPLFLDQGFLCFQRPGWDQHYSRFSSDIRPEVGEGQVWDFEVSNPRKSDATIQVLGINQVPEGCRLVLINEQNSTPYDLRQSNTYRYKTTGEKMSFKLIVGNEGFVKREIVSLTPASFGLIQNYPNPFNPATSIRYTVSQQARVRVEVFSVLGQLVKTLVNDQLDAGVYTAIWDSKNNAGQVASSGVYFTRMLVDGNLVQTMKMVLTK